MLAILRRCSLITARSAINQVTGVIELPRLKRSITFRSRFHVLSSLNKKVSAFDRNYIIEEENGFKMVKIKAPPGAADSTRPGTIEWVKTVGARVYVGDVVCRIRFKEFQERTLDIISPVAGTIAVRKKNEGEPVNHGDELFKIRIDSEVQLQKKEKKKKKTHKHYFEEEEESLISHARKSRDPTSSDIRGAKSGLSGKGESGAGAGINESGNSDDVPATPVEPSKMANSVISLPKQTYLTQRDLIPHPYAKPATIPIPQMMTTINEINMGSTLGFVNKSAKMFEVKYGYKPSLRAIYIKAAAHSLKMIKNLNIKLINNEPVEMKNIEITLGIRYLKVLVFRTMKEIDKMSHNDISKMIYDIENQVSDGTFESEEAPNGFTIVTEWEVDSILGTPSYSKTCTLGIHSIIKRPILDDNKIEAYPMMYVSLTYEKKLIDDHDAVDFLKHFKQAIEEPRHILFHSH